jgi:hypothetical protein
VSIWRLTVAEVFDETNRAKVGYESAGGNLCWLQDLEAKKKCQKTKESGAGGKLGNHCLSIKEAGKSRCGCCI